MSVSSSSSSTSQQLGYLNTAQTLSALLGTTDTALSSLESSQPISISGLSSGINSSEIVAELMKVAAQPQAELQAQLNSASTVLATYQSLSSDIATLQSVSDTLESPSGWQAWIPNSTTQDATATVGSGAIGGSITQASSGVQSWDCAQAGQGWSTAAKATFWRNTRCGMVQPVSTTRAV